MKSTEMLNQIKTLLNIEVKLEEQKLENGTLVSAESFEKGKELFIVTDDEKVAIPVGEYLLEDGRLIVIAEEGIIGDVREVADEAPQKETEEGEEITSDLGYDEDQKMADVADWEGMEKRIQNLEDAIASLKGEKEDKLEEDEEEKEVEMEEEISRQPKSRTIKEEFSEEPAAKPIKHNPEAVSQTKKVEFAKGKFGTTLDRVLNKLNK